MQLVFSTMFLLEPAGCDSGHTRQLKRK